MKTGDGEFRLASLWFLYLVLKIEQNPNIESAIKLVTADPTLNQLLY